MILHAEGFAAFIMTSDQTPPLDDDGSPRRFRDVAVASGLLSLEQISLLEAELGRVAPNTPSSGDPAVWDRGVADLAVARKWLTKFQARELLRGRIRFTLGQYRILDEIGRGGMGHVFKAEYGLMNRLVAVKVLPHSKSNAHTEAAFQREIRMLAKLDHENIVRALDAGYDGSVHYLITEYSPGRDLRRQVERHGPLDQQRAALVIGQAARGLAYAHRQGFVHRDVKPGNILVGRDGRVKLLDLGLAGSLFDADSMRVGRRVGTPGYMAPEQITAPQNVGPAADIYGLGCTLYFAVSGQPPFPGEDRDEKERRQLAGSPPALRALAPHIDEEFAAVVAAMMRPLPGERIGTADEVIDRLRPWLPPVLVPMPSGRRTSMVVPLGSVTNGDSTGSSGLSGIEVVAEADVQAAVDTVRDTCEEDDTFGSSAGKWSVGVPLWREMATAVLFAIPLAFVGVAAGAVARRAVPSFRLGAGWVGIAVFLAAAAMRLCIPFLAASRSRR